MSHKAKLWLLFVLAVLCAAFFMFQGVEGNWDYVLPSRGKKVLAIGLTGAAIAFSTIVFQTLTNNRILTPSIIGLDSLYMLTQTAIIFLYGSDTLSITNKNVNFLLSIGMMMMFAFLLYHFLFR